MKSLGLVLIVLLLFLSFCLYVPRVKAAWLEGWNKRIQIDIDSGDIDTSLSSFPVLIHLSNDSSGIYNENVSCVFDELGTNYLKIAVTVGEDQETFVEVEQWAPDLEIAFLWANVTADDSTNTTLYLYYDINHANNTAYIDVTGTGNSVYVWDSDFEYVYHMRDNTTSTTADSTLNDNDGTKSAVNQPIETESGMIDGAQDFDGANDYIDNPAALPTIYTIEAWAVMDVISERYFHGGVDNKYAGLVGCSSTRRFRAVKHGSDSYVYTGVLLLNTFYYVTFVVNGTYAELFRDGVSRDSDTSANEASTDTALTIGKRQDGKYWNGRVDEVRMSNTARSNSWITASYESGRDHLLDYGVEEVFVLIVYTVTFYNTSGGILRGDCVTIPNGTETEYVNNTVIELAAIVEGNLTYGFDNFTWNGNYNYSNPYNYTVAYGLTNLTLWCYYQPFGVITIEERAFGALGFVVAVIACAIGGAILGKKLL